MTRLWTADSASATSGTSDRNELDLSCARPMSRAHLGSRSPPAHTIHEHELQNHVSGCACPLRDLSGTSTHLPGLEHFTSHIQPLQASHETRVQQHIIALGDV